MASVMVCQGSLELGRVLVATVSLVLVESREGEAERVGVAVPGARLEGFKNASAFKFEFDMTTELRRRG